MNSSSVLLMIIAISISGVFLISPVFADEEHTVRIPMGAASPSCANDDTCYVPSKVTINEGHEVEWINDDSAVHTVTSGTPQDGYDGFFDSGVIMPRGEFEFTFNGFDVGTYPYYCTAHPWMVGSVTGIGFLGAGRIIAQKGHIRGITSAATLWVVAGIGLSIGVGQYVIAIVSSVLVFAILQLGRIENKPSQ